MHDGVWECMESSALRSFLPVGIIFAPCICVVSFGAGHAGTLLVFIPILDMHIPSIMASPCCNNGPITLNSDASQMRSCIGVTLCIHRLLHHVPATIPIFRDNARGFVFVIRILLRK